MIKVASLVLDVTDDVELAVARTFPVEAHACKVASLANPTDADYALLVLSEHGHRRKYARHDADSRKLSLLYLERAPLPADVKAKIAAAINQPTLPPVRLNPREIQPAAKVAFAEKTWGLTVNGRDYFPLHDASLVKHAISRFKFTADDLTPEHTFLYARNLAKRASTLGVEIPAESPVNFYTAAALNTRALAVAIDQRKHAAAGKCETSILDELAASTGIVASKQGAEDDRSYNFRRQKVAKTDKLDPAAVIALLHQFDKLAGIGHREYMRGLLDPFAACFAKLGAAEGIFVDGIDLMRITPADLAGQFDEFAISSFSEDPLRWYKALPDPLKKVVIAIGQQKMGTDKLQPASNDAFLEHGDPMQDLNARYSNTDSVSR